MRNQRWRERKVFGSLSGLTEASDWKARVSCPKVLLVAFTRHLSVMLKAGVNIVQALAALSFQHDCPNFGVAISEVTEGVSTGRSLSDCMREFPRAFAGVYPAVVQVGESTGDLSGALDRLADWLEQEDRTRRRVQTAMTYPALVLSVACTLTLALFYTVIPQFVGIFAGMSVELPFITKVVLWITRCVQNPGLWILCLVAGWAVVSGLQSAWAQPAGRRTIYSAVLRIPVLGRILWLASLSRFCATARMGLETGLDQLQTLQLACQASGSPLIEHDAAAMVEALTQGNRLSQHLRANPRLYHSALTYLLSAGEETADVAPCLERAALYFESEVDHLVTNFGKILEPALLLLVAFLVGFVLLAIFLPMYAYIDAVRA